MSQPASHHSSLPLLFTHPVPWICRCVAQSTYPLAMCDPSRAVAVMMRDLLISASCKELVPVPSVEQLLMPNMVTDVCRLSKLLATSDDDASDDDPPHTPSRRAEVGWVGSRPTNSTLA